jgi:hypothetical protein
LLRSLEVRLLTYLDYNTVVEPGMYDRYVDELGTTLFYAVRGNSAALEHTEWSLPPLTLVQVGGPSLTPPSLSLNSLSHLSLSCCRP